MKKRSTIYAIPLLLIIPIFILLNSCKDDEVTIPNPIEEIKGPDWRNNIGEEVILEAVLALEPEPALFFDFEDRDENRAVSESRYIRLEISPNLMPQLGNQFHGARVSVRGTITEDESTDADILINLLGDSYACILEVVDLPDIAAASDVVYPTYINPCQLHPSICELAVVTERQTYALLYSGGINAGKAYSRYWNDMAFFYFAIVYVQGVEPANVRVVYKDGEGDNNFMPVHYAATQTGLDDAFNWFEERMDQNDRFVFYSTNHGGRGFDDTNNDEIYSEDECIYYYNQNTVVRDDLLATRINDLDFDEFIGIFEPCYGGGQMYDLRGPDRVLVSASTEDQVSYGNHQSAGKYYDHFVFFLTAALAGMNPDGVTVNADINNDGKVSMAEAYEYARINDYKPETTQIDSDGDGLPSHSLSSETGTLAEFMFIAD